MKNTGFIRKVDELGRIVIPIELRLKYGFLEGEEIEIFVKSSDIILRIPEPNCTGILRKLDSLGRIVIPIELRERFNILEKDPIELLTNGSDVVLRKFEPHCVFCQKNEKLKQFKNKLICEDCIEKIIAENTDTKK